MHLCTVLHIHNVVNCKTHILFHTFFHLELFDVAPASEGLSLLHPVQMLGITIW